MLASRVVWFLRSNTFNKWLNRTVRYPDDQEGQILNTKAKLSKSMTLTQFENGYWYTGELKDFAETIGIPSASKLRKDELEKAIIFFFGQERFKSNQEKPLKIRNERCREKG